MTPQLSVVIPTHNRSGQLARTLQALARQTLAPDRYEVIVVADGCEDETAAAAGALRLPYALRVLQQPASGAAAARNLGARAASAPVVLFLDDDMEAEPQLLTVHLGAHQAASWTVGLGYFHAINFGATDDLFQVNVNLWWSGRFAEIAKPSHRFTFMDLFAGNVSMPKVLFDAAGGFEEGFRGKAGEDYELGIRLLKRGARFRFLRDAASVHCDTLTVERSLHRAAAEGRGHVLIARKHPDAFMALPLRAAVEDALPAGAGWIGLDIRRMRLVSRALRAPLAVASALKLRRWWQRFHGVMRACAYWQGVLEETGSFTGLQRVMQEMPLMPTEVTERELDVETHLGRLDEAVESEPADVLRLRYGNMALGRTCPMPCTEPLRACHVRQILIDWYGRALMSALRRRELHAAIRPQDADAPAERPQ